MYKFKKPSSSAMVGNMVLEGETIEQKVGRILNNKEAITDGAPEIFTERKDGVAAGYNIRTDRFEVAAVAMDAVHRSKAAKRTGKANLKVVKEEEPVNVIKVEEGKKEGKA